MYSEQGGLTIVKKAVLTGKWPNAENPLSGRGFGISEFTNWTLGCERYDVDGINIGQQPPWWPSIVRAKIEAIIQGTSPLTGSNATVAIVRVSTKY